VERLPARLRKSCAKEGFQNGIDHTTVTRDIARERARFNQLAQASTGEHRQSVLEKLTQMEVVGYFEFKVAHYPDGRLRPRPRRS
jgi:hypothetical protein